MNKKYLLNPFLIKKMIKKILDYQIDFIFIII